MRNNWLAYILVTLIAWQSVAAVADAHQMHQTGTDHLAFDPTHNHTFDPEQVNSDSVAKDQEAGQQKLRASLASTDSPDCHHCCHCHGNSAQALPSVLAAESYGKHYAFRTPYIKDAAPNFLTPFLRPPIATTSS